MRDAPVRRASPAVRRSAAAVHTAPPPSAPVSAPLRLTPTLVAGWFRFRCARQLRYELVPSALRGGDVPADNTDPAAGPLVRVRPGMGLLHRAGMRWERRKLRVLARRFGPDAVLSAGTDARGDARPLPYAGVVAALRDPGGARFLVQPELRVPDARAFAARHGFDASLVALGAAQPDLLRLRRGRDGRLRVGVCDIKWSRRAGLTHFAQVAFYTLLLEEVVRQEGLPVVVETRRGWIWSRGARGPKPFSLAAYRHHVAGFLADDLPRIAAARAAEAAWHLAPACAGCRFFEHCRAQADAADDLARIPGVTPLAKEVLAAKAIPSVRALAKSLRRDTYAGCHALEANETAIRQRAQALTYGKVFDVAGETRRMGGGERVRLTLACEPDPVTGLAFALGLRTDGAGRASTDVFLSPRGTPEGEGEMLRAFLARLGEVAAAASAAAGDASPSPRRGAPREGTPAFHVFVWERAELEGFRGLLERHVSDPVAQPAIAALLALLFPRKEGGTPAVASSPGTVVTETVAELYALPVPYAFDLPSVSAALTPAEAPRPWRPRADFAWPLSSAVAFERVHNVWTGRPHRTAAGEESPAEVADALRHAVASRLAAVDSVVRAVREREARRRESRLRLDPLAHAGLDGGGPIADPVLESLRIFTEVEAAAEALQITALHALPARDRARRFECIRGMELVERRADGTLVFEFDPECREAKFRPGDFALVLTNEDTDGLAETDRHPWKRRQVMVELVEYDLAAEPPRVVLAPSAGLAKAEERGRASPPLLDLGRVCVLDRAPTDFNTRRVVATLRALAEGRGEAAHVRGLLDGEVTPGWPAPLFRGGGEALLAEASAAYGRPVLNGEQAEAWRAVFDRAATVVWGPPGTGKTYLLAWTLLGMAASARAEGRPLRVLVTAATHRAVANVLARLAKEMAASGIAPPLSAVKLRGSGSETDDELDALGVPVVEDAKLEAFLAAGDAGGPVVVGSTVWSLWKRMRAANGADPEGEEGGESPVRPWFDVVVVDEASQMRVADSLVALSSLREGGRVVFCGDDRQLAPVTRAGYRGDDTRFSSAFAHFAAKLGRVGLRESRRMNAALVSYPRRLFYPGLVSRVPRAALSVSPPGEGWSEEDALLWDVFLRPEHAVVLLTYDGVRATARNPFEARLAARLARVAREAMRMPGTGERYGAAAFAAEGLAVISPHRAQNSAILGEMAAGGWPRDELPVVDTVERMQGAEREMVIVSYAVADGEYAEREAEFLLNPNRFNVSITRPRAKLVVLLGDAVLRTLPRDERVMAESMALKGYPGHCDGGTRAVTLAAPDGTPVAATVRYRLLS
jgi:DNA replication ATP-dependent helicase Dna2